MPNGFFVRLPATGSYFWRKPEVMELLNAAGKNQPFKAMCETLWYYINKFLKKMEKRKEDSPLITIFYLCPPGVRVSNKVFNTNKNGLDPTDSSLLTKVASTKHWEKLPNEDAMFPNGLYELHGVVLLNMEVLSDHNITTTESGTPDVHDMFGNLTIGKLKYIILLSLLSDTYSFENK